MSVRGIEAARAYVRAYWEDSAVRRGIENTKRMLNSAAASIGKLGGGLLVFGGAGLAAFTPVISAASDLQETMSKFNVVFGDNSIAVKAWGDEFASQVGRSERQIADMMASTQDLLVPLGFDSSSALEMSKAISALSIDLASFNNLTDDQTIRDLHAALTGSGEVMKKYGVVVSEAAVKQELLNTAIDPKTATEAQKAQARFAIILRGTTAAQGDAVRSGGGFANMLKRLQGQAFDVAAAVGTSLLPMIETLMQSTTGYVSRLLEWVRANPGLVKGLAIAAVGVVALGGALTALSLSLALTAGGLTVVSALVGFLLSPMGILIGLAGALGVALVQSAGGASEAITYLTSMFPGLSANVSDTFGAIQSALQSGEYKAAAKILWLGLKQAWLIGIDALKREWLIWKHAFLSTFDSAAAYVQKKWASLQNTLAKGVVKFMAYFDSTIDVQAVSNELDGMLAQQTAQIETEVKANQKARSQQFDSDIGSVNADLEAARKEWADAVAAARDMAAKRANEPNVAEEAGNKFNDLLQQLKAGAAASSIESAINRNSGAQDVRSVQGVSQLTSLINRTGDIPRQSLAVLKAIQQNTTNLGFTQQVVNI